MTKIKSLIAALILSVVALSASAATVPFSDNFPEENNEIKFSTDHKFTKTIYIDAKDGDDSNSGASIKKPIRSLEKLGTMGIENGWQILLKGGEVYKGCIDLVDLNDHDSEKLIHIGSYGEGKATIDAAGYANGIYIFRSSNITITDLKITGNGSYEGDRYMVRDMEVDARDRIGIQILNRGGEQGAKDMKNITIYNIDFYDIYYYNIGDKNTPTNRPCRSWSEPSVHYGYAIKGYNQAQGTQIDNVLIKECTVRNVSNMGVQLTGGTNNVFNRLKFTGCNFRYTGGPGYMFANCNNSVLEKSRTYHSGSFDDPRKWGRGSGMWLMNCDGFLIERNHFEGASGIGDSCGAHIDHGNRNVTIQYCVSKDNAGGFVEILGKNRNCSYRYNVSIDDGWRNTQKNDPIQSEKYWAGTTALTLGTLVSVCGYTGKDFIGPYQTYVYNNTIVSTDKRADGFINPFVFQVTTSATGVLIANNIFYVPQQLYEGWSQHIITKDGEKVINEKAFDFRKGFQDGDDFDIRDMTQEEVEALDFVLENNLYKLYDPAFPYAENALPNVLSQDGVQMGYLDTNALGGDPGFANPEGKSIEDLIPSNKSVIERGIAIKKLESDKTSYGLSTLSSDQAEGTPLGLEVKYDIFGNAITKPIIGAIVAQ